MDDPVELTNRALELTDRAQATHFWFRGFRRFLSPILDDVANGRRDLRLIDCGCGNGHNLPLLRQYGRVFAFDLIAAGIARARATGCPLAFGDVTRIPFASNSFDIATSFDVLQCIEGDLAAVREMARIVKPGGIVVLSVAALEMLRGDHSVAWQEVRRYSPRTIREVVDAAGLRAERVSFLFGSLFPLMFAVRMWQRMQRTYGRHAGDADIEIPAAPVNSVLTALVAGEAALARHASLPFGSSLLVVARKADATRRH